MPTCLFDGKDQVSLLEAKSYAGIHFYICSNNLHNVVAASVSLSNKLHMRRWWRVGLLLLQAGLAEAQHLVQTWSQLDFWMLEDGRIGAGLGRSLFNKTGIGESVPPLVPWSTIRLSSLSSFPRSRLLLMLERGALAVPFRLQLST